jgi:peptidoglycan/xylan/chitin deacetylase (PgdA/CDA1 family)
MKRIVFAVMALLVIVSCSPVTQPATAASTNMPTGTALSTATPTDTPTATPTATPIPTPTFTPSPVPTEREIVLASHEEERIQYLAEQGPASEIPVFEYHGDNYYFDYGNAIVELSPPAFERQMKWFHENHVHAVTGTELNDWLQGKIELPARSVVLTFDVGNGSMVGIRRVITVFEKYQMFGIFTIFVQGMNPEESAKCVNDVCWQGYRDAYLSGYVDIGSHTMTHRDFATLTEKVGIAELATSKKIIEEKIGNGCIVISLTWPYESVPKWARDISTIGFTIAFGGNTYPILKNAIWRDKPDDFFKLPRILPPGSFGLSGRPNNKTLQQIMQMYTNGWK